MTSSHGKFHKAYLVLGGDGWRLRDFFVGRQLKELLRLGDSVAVVTLEAFIGLANQGKL
ncbi:MAG: hypothetical protein QHJ34_04645 [bacterium]|nr:hypothetical protein [candidate division KSB1 bacterium]MDH7559506.1 hypothetical protein [bacterium]